MTKKSKHEHLSVRGTSRKLRTPVSLMETAMSILAQCMKAIGWAIVVPKTTKVRYLVIGEPDVAQELMQVLDVRPPLDRRRVSKGKTLSITERYTCPFCKKALTTLVHGTDGTRVRCDTCGALGPVHKSFEGAELAWNGHAVTLGSMKG